MNRYRYLNSVFIFVTLFLLVTAHGQDAEEKSFSTSVAGMEQLLITEQVLINTVDKYADELRAKADSLKKLVNDLRTENQKGVTNPEEYLYNPLNGFSLIRRMSYDWTGIELYLTQPVGESLLDVLRRYRPEMPTSRDLTEASEAIYRVQRTYDFKADDIAQGILNGKLYDVKLKSIDRYFMGLHMFGKEEYYNAGYWIYSSINSYEESDYNHIVDFGLEKVYSLYAETLLKQNRHRDALISIEKATNLRPENAVLLSRKNEIEEIAKQIDGPPIVFNKPTPTSYELGCRGAFSNQPSRLYCVYNTTTSAFLRLAPIKMEILNLDPYMVMFHDVMSDSEIKDLQDLAKPNLKRATVFSQKAGKSQVVETRTSKFSWFHDGTSNTTIRINQRIVDMTGFDIYGSEMLQVMNYGLGGHYDNHYDFFNVSDTADVVRMQGDRISTVLFYLTDVEQGGGTVFPNIQKAVFPRKGSAVMWYNLNNEVVGDWRTLHAACPVIFGSKWVCNKWIRSKAQIFRKPCYAS